MTSPANLPAKAHRTTAHKAAHSTKFQSSKATDTRLAEQAVAKVASSAGPFWARTCGLLGQGDAFHPSTQQGFRAFDSAFQSVVPELAQRQAVDEVRKMLEWSPATLKTPDRVERLANITYIATAAEQVGLHLTTPSVRRRALGSYNFDRLMKQAIAQNPTDKGLLAIEEGHDAVDWLKLFLREWNAPNPGPVSLGERRNFQDRLFLEWSKGIQQSNR